MPTIKTTYKLISPSSPFDFPHSAKIQKSLYFLQYSLQLDFGKKQRIIEIKFHACQVQNLVLWKPKHF